jgi:hypothetical protein
VEDETLVDEHFLNPAVDLLGGAHAGSDTWVNVKMTRREMFVYKSMLKISGKGSNRERKAPGNGKAEAEGPKS